MASFHRQAPSHHSGISLNFHCDIAGGQRLEREIAALDVCHLLFLIGKLTKWRRKDEAISPDTVEQFRSTLQVSRNPSMIQVIELLLDPAI